jgi:hypothetical protein
MDGLLCSDCLTLKTKEYIQREQEEKELQAKEENTCSICRLNLDSDSKKFKPRWQWNLDKTIILCKNCFEKKENDFRKERNDCAICNRNLKFFRYNPKPNWNIKGQLCRECWDRRNLVK